jgi:hypothetical protein
MKTEFGLFNKRQYKVERDGIIPFTKRCMVVKKVLDKPKGEEGPIHVYNIAIYKHAPFIAVEPIFEPIWEGTARTPRKAIKKAQEETSHNLASFF